MKFITRTLALAFLLSSAVTKSEVLELDETCVVNVLNRTIQVQPDGSWFLTNVPSTMGQIRARATCLRDGGSITGVTDYFLVTTNFKTQVPLFYTQDDFDNSVNTPTSLDFTNVERQVYVFDEDEVIVEVGVTNIVELDTVGQAFQLASVATYANGSQEDVSEASSGINYWSSSTDVATVSADGEITAVVSGASTVVARLDGVLAAVRVNVSFSGDADGDGLPDDYEKANGLNPQDPADAFEDQDGDGLSALDEYNLGTDPFDPDSDNDGIDDREESEPGADGVVTNPLLTDSDGDGVNDGLEVQVGSDPNDPTDTGVDAATASIRSTPANVLLTFNGIDTEVSTQLNITAVLIDGSQVDITDNAGTTYTSSDLTVVSFSATPGEVFGGTVGEAVVTVSFGGESVEIPVVVEAFEPVGVSSFSFTGTGRDTDVNGDHVYIAATTGGMHIVNVANRENPQLESTVPTSGSAQDVKVVGSTAFVAASTSLDIVDVTSPDSPSLTSNLPLPGTANDLAVQNGIVFVSVGTAGVQIVDVSDEANPRSIAAIENIGSVVGVDAQGDRLVVGTTSSLIVYDIDDVDSPIRLGSVNIGNLRAVVMDGDYAYVAAYTGGYKVVRISEPTLPVVVGTGAGFYPSDVELTNGFAFFSDILFTNAVPFVNIFDPENPIFQGVIDIRQFGDRDAVGLSLDASYVYSTGSNRLYISQYRQLNDAQGVPPTVSFTSPLDNDVVVEGSRFIARADAVDDIAVASVTFLVNGQAIFTDTTRPYEAPVTVPSGDTLMTLSARGLDLGSNTSQVDITLNIEPDADLDGLGDSEEVNTWGTDPNDADSDDDGLNDGEEVDLGTNPNNTDSDNDGTDDKTEVDNDTDPLNPDVTPPTISETAPLDTATDIPENSSVRVIFDEPLRARSVNSASLQVVADGGSTPLAGTLQLTSSNTELIFVPSALMQDFTLYNVTVSGVKDEAGNPIVTAGFSFTTGNFVDTVRPSVLDISPANNATGVPLNSLVDVIISEPIIPETVTPDTFYLLDQSTGLRFEGELVVSDDKTVISFVPNTPFLVGRRYRVVIGSGIQDLFGLAMISTNRYFTTAFEGDGDAPQVLSTTVSEGESGLPTNGLLRVGFSEMISPLYIQGIRLLDGTGAEVEVQRSLSADRKVVQLDPVPVLDPNANYRFLIDGVRDPSGNLLPQPLDIGFTTSADTDTARGGVSDMSFINGSELPLNAVLEVYLSERVDPTTVITDESAGQATFGLYSVTQGRLIDGSAVVSDDGRTVRFERAEALRPGHTYRLYPYWNLRMYDQAGNYFNGSYRTFTAGFDEDAEAPVSEGLSIVDGATEVPINSSLFFRSAEPIGAGCLGDVALRLGGVPVDAAVSLDTSGTTLTINPNVDLAADTEYQLALDGLCDYAGNTLASGSVRFTTSSSSDTTGPVLQSMDPANGASNVAVDSSVVLTYDEPLSQLTAPIVTGAGFTLPGTYTVAGNTVTFTPSITMTGTTQYSINTTAIDIAGNSRSSGTRRFTTASLEDNTPPTVVAVTPDNGDVDVNPLGKVVLSFSEPMSPASINNLSILFHANGQLIFPSVYRSADGRQVTLTAAFPSESVVTLVVRPLVQDLAGNATAAYVSSFTTSVLDNDGTRPSVSRVLPGNGTSGWLGVDEVVMYVNEPLDPATVEDAFHIAQNGILIDDQGTLEVLGDGRTVRYRKDEPFAEGALVQVYLSDLARDLVNNPLNNFSSYFNMGTTSDGIGVRPIPQVYSPASSSQNVALNPELQVLWSEPLDPDSLTDVNVYLEKNYNGTRIPATISLNTLPGDIGFDTVPGQIMTVTPDVLLDPPVAPATSQIYYLRLAPGIADTDGDTHGANRNMYIYTGPASVDDDRVPLLSAVNPPQGEKGVGTNPYYAVWLDESVSNMVAYSYDFGRPSNVQFSQSNQIVRYLRNETLPANSEVTEVLPAFRDFSGNQVVGNTTFTTGSGPDLAAGNTVSISVASNATDVPLNPVLVREFSEPVDPVSVSPANIYVYDTSTGERPAVTVSLSADGRRITMVPIVALKPGRRYYWYASGLRDIGGNTVSSSRYTLTTGFDEDSTPPAVISTTVFDGQTEVPTNARLRVRFDESIRPAQVAGAQLLDGAGDPVPVNLSFNGDRRTMTLVPRQLLAAGSDYTLSVADLQDVSGNTMASPLVIAFSTAASIDNEAGSVVGWSFANGAEVPLNAVMEIELSELVDPTSIITDDSTGEATFGLYSVTQGRLLQGRAVLSADGRRIRHERDEDLQPGHTYRLYPYWNVRLTDLVGKNFSGSYRTFTAGVADDSEAPEVLGLSIPDGVADLPVNSRFTFQAGEPISPTCLDVVELRSGGVPVAASVGLDGSGTILTVTPSAALATDTSYELSVDGLCDYAGNLLSTSVVQFTTAVSDVPDASGPVLQSIDPANGATGVAVDSAVVLTYDEPLSLLTAPVVSGAGITVPGQYVVTGNTVTFTPSVALVGSTQYSVNTTAVDLAGNSRSNGTRRFTTTSMDDNEPPVVTALSPENGALDVSPVSKVVLNFSEPMAPGTINNLSILFHSNGQLIFPTVYRSADGTQVTLTAAFPSESVVTLVVRNLVEDLSGNAIAPYVSSFTTSLLNTDGSRPSVSRVIPGNGTTGWLGLNEVVLYTNEPLDAGTVADAFNIAENGVLINDQGVVEALGDGRTVRFTKDTAFTEGALVQYYLSDAATDLANNPLSNYSGYFTMGSTSDGVGVRPVPQVYAPSSSTANVALNPEVQVLWSEPLDPTSLTDVNVYLEKNYNGTRVPATVSLNTEPGDVGYAYARGRIMTVSPAGALDLPVDPATSQIYYLRMNAGIADTDGDTHGSNRNMYFYTGPDSVEDDRAPVITAVNPPDGEDNVGTNPYYAVSVDEAISRMVAYAHDFGLPSNVQFSQSDMVVRYVRNGTLPSNAEVTETLPVFQDIAGNTVTGSTTFDTGSGPDLASGSTLSISVASNATNVPRNPVLVREFSEPLDPVSVGSSGVYLYDTTNAVRPAVTVTLSADGHRLTMVPLAALESGRRYYWYASGLRDISGNSVSSSRYTLTTGFDEDTTGPLFDAATVFDGQIDVPTNARFKVRFNEPLSPWQIAGVELLDSGGASVPVNISFNADRRTVTLVPRLLLSALSDYTLSVADVEDVSGNALATPVSIDFTTSDAIDNEAGSVIGWSFVNGAVLPLNPVLEIELSELVDPASIITDETTGEASFGLYDVSQGRLLSGQAVLNADGRRLRFVSSEDLQPGQTYRFYPYWHVRMTDLAGKNFGGSYRTFTTADSDDNDEPSIVATTIFNGQTGVPVNPRLEVQFDEPVSSLSYNEFAIQDEFGSEVPSTLSVNSNSTVFSLTPLSWLDPDSNYSFVVDGFKDLAGNELATPRTYDLTTGSAEDVARGNVTQYSYAADATLPVDAVLSVDLSERISPTTVDPSTFYLWDELAGVVVPGTITLSVDGTSLTFEPDANLDAGGRYRLYVSYGNYFRDLAYNLINRSTRRFYTEN